MRKADEIRTELLRLRDRKRLPFTYISAQSRCSDHELRAACRLEATEGTLRKLDAFLDATHLHVRVKHTRLLYEFERLDHELYSKYGAKSLHPLTVQKMSPDKQQRLVNSMHNRAKTLLRDQIEKETGTRLLFPDGLNYWQCKAKARARGAAVRTRD